MIIVWTTLPTCFAGGLQSQMKTLNQKYAELTNLSFTRISAEIQTRLCERSDSDKLACAPNNTERSTKTKEATPQIEEE